MSETQTQRHHKHKGRATNIMSRQYKNRIGAKHLNLSKCQEN